MSFRSSSRSYPFSGRIPRGPVARGTSNTKAGAKAGAVVVTHLSLKAAWPSGADSKHWTAHVFSVRGYTVTVHVRLFPGPENPVARLRGSGRGKERFRLV